MKKFMEMYFNWSDWKEKKIVPYFLLWLCHNITELNVLGGNCNLMTCAGIYTELIYDHLQIISPNAEHDILLVDLLQK